MTNSHDPAADDSPETFPWQSPSAKPLFPWQEAAATGSASPETVPVADLAADYVPPVASGALTQPLAQPPVEPVIELPTQPVVEASDPQAPEVDLLPEQPTPALPSEPGQPTAVPAFPRAPVLNTPPAAASAPDESLQNPPGHRRRKWRPEWRKLPDEPEFDESQYNQLPEGFRAPVVVGVAVVIFAVVMWNWFT